MDVPIKTVLVTSSGESEGKSTVAANLAIVEAQSGKKVVIVDADMRRPKVHVQFNKPNRIGLSDIITGKMSIDDVIKTHEQVENLSIITCGTLPPNPAELLGSDRMSWLIDTLETTFDMVILDSPPMIVSDAQVLSTKVDGVIYVVIPGQTRAVNALRPLEELRRVDSRVLGVVANRIPRNRDSYYGGYNYYSPYSNHYSYHTESIAPDEISFNSKEKVIPLGTVFNDYKRKKRITGSKFSNPIYAKELTCQRLCLFVPKITPVSPWLLPSCARNYCQQVLSLWQVDSAGSWLLQPHSEAIFEAQKRILICRDIFPRGLRKSQEVQLTRYL